MSEPTIKGRPFVITKPDQHGWCCITAADGSDLVLTVNGNWRAPPAPCEDLFFYKPPDKVEAFAAGQCDSGLVAELLADRETLRNRLAEVCGALADAGDVVFSVENPGAAVRELVEKRNAERAARERLVAEWRAAPWKGQYTEGLFDAADQLAALDKPEGA